MGDFNPGGAINALAGISKAADKLPSTPATTPQRQGSAPSPKPVAPASRGAAPVAVQPGLHREDRSRPWPSALPDKPTKAPLQSRSASPAAYATSGIEQAMGALADKLHKPVHRYAKAQGKRK